MLLFGEIRIAYSGAALFNLQKHDNICVSVRVFVCV